MLILETRRPGGRVLLGGASLPYRSIGVLEKKFAEIFGKFEFVLVWMSPRYTRRRLRDATNQELPKSNPGAPASQRGSLRAPVNFAENSIGGRGAGDPSGSESSLTAAPPIVRFHTSW